MISTEKLLSDASNLIACADMVLANTHSTQDVNPFDCYDLASKLEKARNILLVIGDRILQEDRNVSSLEAVDAE